MVEVVELCTSHALKMNPGLRLRELADEAGYEPGVWRGEMRSPLRLARQGAGVSLLQTGEIERVDVQFDDSFEGRLALVLSGSAGEGAQRAAELFAQAAMACGLHVTKKGSYPVTVGVGFSSAEVILSRDPIAYHGVSQPDYVVITSEDGLAHSLRRVEAMSGGTVWLDESLAVPSTGAEVRARDFRGRAGPRNAAILGVLTLMEETDIIPTAAMLAAIRESSIAGYVPDDLLRPFG
jgi:Pyruvate/2-oxoacid:ferredoxin oxidoreductase gamma subunit